MRGSWGTVLVLCGCSASSLDAPAGPAGISPPDAGPACERNFYTDEVVCYPIDDVGTRSRTRPDGGVAFGFGSRMPDLKLVGYEQHDPNLPVDLLPGIRIVPLSDFYDPESRRLRLLEIVVAAAWCGPSVQQIQAITSTWGQALAPRGVEFLEVLDQRASGTPATPEDLLAWIQQQQPKATSVVHDATLDLFQPDLAVPWVLFVDPRSMELLGFEIGYDSQFGATQRWIDWIDANPPRP